MLSLKDFKKSGLEYAFKCDSIFGGTDGRTEKTLETHTNERCGDTKRTLYKEDGSICCEDITYECCIET